MTRIEFATPSRVLTLLIGDKVTAALLVDPADRTKVIASAWGRREAWEVPPASPTPLLVMRPDVGTTPAFVVDLTSLEAVEIAAALLQ